MIQANKINYYFSRMGVHQKPWDPKMYSARSRCQSWTANIKEKRSPKPISK